MLACPQARDGRDTPLIDTVTIRANTMMPPSAPTAISQVRRRDEILKKRRRATGKGRPILFQACRFTGRAKYRRTRDAVDNRLADKRRYILSHYFRYIAPMRPRRHCHGRMGHATLRQLI